MLGSRAPSEPPELKCRKYQRSGAKRQMGYAYFFSVLLTICWHPPWIEVAAAAADGTRTPSNARFREGATFYEMLGVSKRANQKDIKLMFRELALRMHPDKLMPFESDDAEVKANELFMKIRMAYETLSDPIERQKYDMGGMRQDAIKDEPEIRYDNAPFGIFVRFGGGRGGLWFRYKGHGQRSAPDIEVAVELTYEEAFFGKTVNVTVTRERLCHTCGATGSAKPEEMPTCSLCEGKGYAYHLFGVRENAADQSSGQHHHHHHHHPPHGSPRDRCTVRGEDGWGRDGVGEEGRGDGEEEEDVSMPEYAHAVNTTCKVCGGMGKISDGGCPDCRGRKVKAEAESFEVVMPAGVLPRHTISISGKGAQHPDQLDGNLRFVAVQLPHARFEREGANLLYKAKITLIDALLGFWRRLTLPDGMRVPIIHDQMTLSGFRRELPGLGFPVVEGDGERGDLIIDFEVNFPPRLTEEHLSILSVMLTPEEIAMLEDVLKLMSAKKGQQRHAMDPLELEFSRSCCDDEPPVCIPDLLWWTRSAGRLIELDREDDGQPRPGPAIYL